MKQTRSVAVYPCAFLLALAGVCCAGEARADLIVGNLTAPLSGSASFTSLNVRFAAPFTLDAGFTPSTLDAITMPLALSSDQTDPSFVQVSLWSDNASLPGSPLVVVAGAQLLSGTIQEFFFAASFPFTLQPATAYWIVLEKTGGIGSARWGATTAHTLDPGGSPFADIPPGIRAISTDNGATWVQNELEFRFAVHGTPIPEPAVALLALGALVTRRRRGGA